MSIYNLPVNVIHNKTIDFSNTQTIINFLSINSLSTQIQVNIMLFDIIPNLLVVNIQDQSNRIGSIDSSKRIIFIKIGLLSFTLKVTSHQTNNYNGTNSDQFYISDVFDNHTNTNHKTSGNNEYVEIY